MIPELLVYFATAEHTVAFSNIKSFTLSALFFFEIAWSDTQTHICAIVILVCSVWLSIKPNKATC